MDQIISFLFRFILYVAMGFTLEIIFSVVGIEKVLGVSIPKRVPKKYLEGWVSLYMIPIHGLGMALGFEAIRHLIINFHISLRYLIYALLISSTEALTGWIYDKLTGFYSWDYYELSRYKVFKRGYTLWTLIPLWGFAGLVMEVYVGLFLYLGPYVPKYFYTLMGQ